MNIKFLFLGVKNILADPGKAWQSIDNENRSARYLRDSLLLPLIILVSISAMAGSLMFSDSELKSVHAIFTGIKTFLVLICTVYAAAYLLSEVTHPLDLGRDFYVSFTIIIFSFIPFFLCQIFSSLFESLLFVNILALYGLYIFWEGAVKLLSPPDYKKVPLLIAATALVIILYVSINKVLTLTMDKIFYTIFD
jgi:hypothetical protein